MESQSYAGCTVVVNEWKKKKKKKKKNLIYHDIMLYDMYTKNAEFRSNSVHFLRSWSQARYNLGKEHVSKSIHGHTEDNFLLGVKQEEAKTRLHPVTLNLENQQIGESVTVVYTSNNANNTN